jgi:uncharacterized oligopeptide transporter (OPT) family protein
VQETLEAVDAVLGTDRVLGLRLCADELAPWAGLTVIYICMSLAFFGIGFTPITALAVAIIGIVSLPISGLVLVWPAIVLFVVLGLLFPAYGKLALKGLVIGLIACFLYD